MGTRCNITFEGSKVVLFQHWDGYPDGDNGVLERLQPLVTAFQDERGHEPDMLIAFVVGKFREGVTQVTGYRLDTKLSSDVEYIYRVKADGSIEVRQPNGAYFERPIYRNTRKYAPEV